MVVGPLVIEILLAAAGIAINPPAVIAAILLVASSRHKAIAFSGGCVFGLLIVGSIIMVVGEVAEQPSDVSVPMLVAKAVVGIALLGLAVTKWRSHCSSSGDKELPGWMSQLYVISAWRAFVAAAAYTALNPKTIAFNAAGVLAILAASLSKPAEWASLLLFVLLASLSVTVPIIGATLFPRRSAGMLATAERWLVNNSSAVAAAVLLVLGLMVLYSAAEALMQIYPSA